MPTASLLRVKGLNPHAPWLLRRLSLTRSQRFGNGDLHLTPRFVLGSLEHVTFIFIPLSLSFLFLEHVPCGDSLSLSQILNQFTQLIDLLGEGPSFV